MVSWQILHSKSKARIRRRLYSKLGFVHLSNVSRRRNSNRFASWNISRNYWDTYWSSNLYKQASHVFLAPWRWQNEIRNSRVACRLFYWSQCWFRGFRGHHWSKSWSIPWSGQFSSRVHRIVSQERLGKSCYSLKQCMFWPWAWFYGRSSWGMWAHLFGRLPTMWRGNKYFGIRPAPFRL